MPPKFGYEEKLHSRRDFGETLRGGKSFASEYVRVAVLVKKEGAPRMGLVVSRKLGGAAVRNKVKRRLREIFRLTKGKFKSPADVIFLPKAPISGLKYRQMKEVVLAAFRAAGVVE